MASCNFLVCHRVTQQYNSINNGTSPQRFIHAGEQFGLALALNTFINTHQLTLI